MNPLLKIKEKSPHLSWIDTNTVYLVRHGSHAYNTNIETSDEDFKGVCIPPINYLLGFQHNFEQAELKDPDTVIYELKKFFNLAAASNPNIIEVLFVDPSDIIYSNKFGDLILQNRDKFLSKRIKFTFTGYSISQLKRIKTHRKWLLSPPKNPPSRADLGLPEKTLIPQDQLLAAEAEIQKELNKFNLHLDELSESSKIAIKNTMSEILTDLKIFSDDQWIATGRKIGLDENFIHLLQLERNYRNAKTEWDQYQNWKNNRNPERAALEAKFGYDSKHAYHLVRLIRMCQEILITGKVIVKRPDREELLYIRNGGLSYEQLIEFAETADKNMQLLYESSILPKTPDFNFLDNLCIQIISEFLNVKKIG